MFSDGHYADAVFSAVKLVNVELKEKVKNLTGVELDGTKIMQRTFSSDSPILILGDLDTQIGKDLQQGYQQIFSGAIIGIRNPKSHGMLKIDKDRAIHLLFLAGLLMCKIDEATLPPPNIS